MLTPGLPVGSRTVPVVTVSVTLSQPPISTLVSPADHAGVCQASACAPGCVDGGCSCSPVAETASILTGLRPKYEEYHGDVMGVYFTEFVTQ